MPSACSLQCCHCSSAEHLARHRADGAISIEKLCSWLRAAREDVSVCLTGGEPLYAPLFWKVADQLSRLSRVREWGIYTSGCVPDEVAGISAIKVELVKRMKAARMSFCYVSLYAAASAIHDRITGVLGSHDLTVLSIRNMTHSGLDVRAHFVPMRMNREAILSTLTFAAELGVREFRLLRLVKHGRAAKNWKVLGLSRREQASVAQDCLKWRSTQPGGMSVTVAGFPELCPCRPVGTGKACQRGISLFYLDYTGSLYPCACAKRNPANRIDPSELTIRLAHAPKDAARSARYCLQDVDGTLH